MNLINPIYLKQETQSQLQTHFNEDPEFRSVTLSQFFTKEGLETILNEIIETEFSRDDNEIIHRREKSDLTPSLSQLLDDDGFNGHIHGIVGRELQSFSGNIYKFGHKDYRIIHDDAIRPPGFDLIMDLTPEWDDDLGGYVTYTDGEGAFHTIPANFGSITLVERTEKYHYFVKYVNHYAENLKRYLLIADTEVER